MSDTQPQATAMSFCTHSKEMFTAANILIASREHQGDHWNPIYYLLGHALELASKSILLADGASVGFVRNKIGHNLQEAASAIISREIGLAAEIVETHFDIIAWLNQYYQAKEFEYRVVGYKSLPACEELVSILENLLPVAEKLAMSVYPGR